MSQTAMTVRLDSEVKTKFDSLCSEFGMSANTAFTIFVNAVIRYKKIPFEIAAASTSSDVRERAVKAVENMRAKTIDLPEMSLDEINEVIRESRLARK